MTSLLLLLVHKAGKQTILMYCNQCWPAAIGHLTSSSKWPSGYNVQECQCVLLGLYEFQLPYLLLFTFHFWYIFTMVRAWCGFFFFSFPPNLLMDVIGKSQHLSWGWSSRFCMHSGLLLQETCLLQWVPHTYSVVYLYFQCVTSPFCSYLFFLDILRLCHI